MLQTLRSRGSELYAALTPFVSPDLARFEFRGVNMHCINYLLLQHPSRFAAYFVHSTAGLTLPNWTDVECGLWQVVSGIAFEGERILGFEVVVLRCLQNAISASEGYHIRIYEVAPATENAEPRADGIWIDASQISDQHLAMPWDPAVLTSWILRRPGSEDAPWRSREWFGKAHEWIHSELGRMGLQLTSVIQQRTWERSCILIADSGSDRFFFKASPPFAAYELEALSTLPGIRPGAVPPVISVDPERAWSLTRACVGTPLNELSELHAYCQALRQYGEIQFRYADIVQDRGKTLPLRPLEDLPDWLDRFLQTDRSELPKQELDCLAGLIPALRFLVSELAASGVPLSLEHGDFWPGQVVYAPSDCTFLDWSDASVSHPFLSFGSFIFFSERLKDGDSPYVRESIRTVLEDAYLEYWAATAPRAQLSKALSMCSLLWPLSKAHHHYEFVMPLISPGGRWELEQTGPFFLRLFLQNWQAEMLPPAM